MKLKIICYDINRDDYSCEDEFGESVRLDLFIHDVWPRPRVLELEGKWVEVDDGSLTHSIYGPCYIPEEITFIDPPDKRNDLYIPAELLNTVRNCADCDQTVPDGEDMYIKCRSARIGVYYQGQPICGKCSEERYKTAIRELEAKQIEEDGKA